MIHQEAYMNANFDEKLSLKNGKKTVAARGPCVDWKPNDKSALIENVRIETDAGELALSLQSVTVTPSDMSWALDVSSSSQLTPGSAEAYAHVTVTRNNGSHYHPPCEHDVVLLSP
jgi:hypothetical protein